MRLFLSFHGIVIVESHLLDDFLRFNNGSRHELRDVTRLLSSRLVVRDSRAYSVNLLGFRLHYVDAGRVALFNQLRLCIHSLSLSLQLKKLLSHLSKWIFSSLLQLFLRLDVLNNWLLDRLWLLDWFRVLGLLNLLFSESLSLLSKLLVLSSQTGQLLVQVFNMLSQVVYLADRLSKLGIHCDSERLMLLSQSLHLAKVSFLHSLLVLTELLYLLRLGMNLVFGVVEHLG